MKARTPIITAVRCWRLLAGAAAVSTGAALAFSAAPVASAQISLTASPRSGGGGASLYGVSCTGAHACEAVGYYFNSGDFTLAEGWNGTKWTVQTTPNPTGTNNNSLNGVSCTGAGACEAVGYYTNSSGNRETLAEVWNGSKWAIQSTPNPSGNTGSVLEGLSCTAANACEAAGYYTNSSGVVTLAEVWNGAKWAIQSTPNPSGNTGSSLSGVSCTGAGACEAVGYYTNSSGAGVTLAEVWNGTKWAVQKTPNPSGSGGSFPDAVSCTGTGAGACEAGGEYHSSAGIVTLAEGWNGTKWAVQKTPNPSGSTGSGSILNGVSCTGVGACEAVGDYQKSTAFLTLAEVWNGTKWAVQKTPNPSGSPGSFFLYGVSCTAANACEAVGSANASSGVPTLAEVWNGVKWVIQTTPTP